MCRTFPGVHRHDVSGSQPTGEKRLRVCPRSLKHCRSLHVHQRLPKARAAGQSSAAVLLPLSAFAASLTSLLLHLLQDFMISLILPDWFRTSSFFLKQLASMGHHAEVCSGKKNEPAKSNIYNVTENTHTNTHTFWLFLLKHLTLNSFKYVWYHSFFSNIIVINNTTIHLFDIYLF